MVSGQFGEITRVVLVLLLVYFYFPVCHYNKISLLSSYFPRRMNSTKFPLALCFVLVLTLKQLLQDSPVFHYSSVGLGYYYVPGRQPLLQENRHLTQDEI